MNYNEFVLKTLTTMLTRIQTGTVPYKSWGLCNNMTELIRGATGTGTGYEDFDEWFDTGSKIVQEFSTDWPLHTGSFDYPVPVPATISPDSMSASSIYAQTQNMYVDTYGELRISLLHYMIGRVTERINNVKAIGG